MSTPNPNPKTPILNQGADLMRLESSFLDFNSLTAFSSTCFTFRELNKKRLTDLREMASKLLDHVLNIDDNRKKKIIELLAKAKREDIFSIALIPVAIGRELYFSSEQNKIVCKREWHNLTPLEAAAICGDFPILRLLKDSLLENQKQEAGSQLLVLRKRKDFLSLFFAARHALRQFVTQVPILYSKKDYETINTLCGQHGEAQKALSKFGRQVLCNPKPNKPHPDFTLEPRRSCLLLNDIELDLDSIGLSSCCALFKGRVGAAMRHGCVGVTGWRDIGVAAYIDLEAFDLFCKVIPREIDNITGELLNYPSDKLDSLSLNANLPQKDPKPTAKEQNLDKKEDADKGDKKEAENPFIAAAIEKEDEALTQLAVTMSLQANQNAVQKNDNHREALQRLDWLKKIEEQRDRDLKKAKIKNGAANPNLPRGN